MHIVYLDQNKWIDLARASYGKSSHTALRTTLDCVNQASSEGRALFPLSSTHYIEIARIGKPARRERLGRFMWSLSHGHTFAALTTVLKYELEIALSKYFPEITPSPFQLISKGVAHAFSMDYGGYRIPDIARQNLDPSSASVIEAAAQEVIELSILTGAGPDGLVMQPFRETKHNFQFMRHLQDLHPDLLQLPKNQWVDALHAISLADILGPLNDVLARHRVSADRFSALGKDRMKSLLHEVPTRRVDLHLHRQILKNPRLRPKRTDLEDWAGLGPATTYSDVVVCEKHFARLLLRDGYRPEARVITDLRELPAALI